MTIKSKATLQQIPAGTTGMCRVYDMHANKWKEVWPIDAREGVVAGGLSLDGPVHTMEKEGHESIQVCPEQVESFQNDGWIFSGGEEGAPAPAPEEKVADGEVVDFNEFGIKELRKFATKAKIDGVDKLTREQLIAALDAAKFIP